MHKKNERLLYLLILLLFISLRIAFIDQKNLWFDEVFSWHMTLGTFSDIIVRTALDIHPPFFYFVLKAWNWVFGDSVFSMRFLSTLFSALSLFYVYPLSKRVLEPNYSLIYLVLFAVNPLNVFYSQEARMSALNLFLNAASVYYFVRMSESKLLLKPSLNHPFIYLYVLFRTLALYTHYFSFFIFAVELAAMVLVKGVRSFRNSMPFMFAFASSLILYVPWFPALLMHITKGQSWRYQQAAHNPLAELLNFLKDLNLGLYYHYSNLKVVNAITVVLVITYTTALILSIPKKWRHSNPALLFLLVCMPILIALVISTSQKIEFYRYLSIIVPFVLLLFVYGILKIRKGIIVYSILFILMVVNLYGLSIQYSFDFKNDDYRGLIKHIEMQGKITDRIYVEPHYMSWEISFYRKQWCLKMPEPANIRFGWNEILDSLLIQKPERFWLVLDYSSVDTSKYTEYVDGLRKDFKIDDKITYYLAPQKVELYEFSNRSW